MKTNIYAVKIVIAVILGCVATSVLWMIVGHVNAQDQSGPVHVCVAQDGILHVVPFASGCKPGERSLSLKRAVPQSGGEKPKKNNNDQTTLDGPTLQDINRRLIKLEEMGCAAFGKRRVVAPFEVVGRDGKRMFYVANNAAGLFDASGKNMATIQADQSGGLFTANAQATKVVFGINSPTLAGISVSEAGKTRIQLGKGIRNGTYRLLFLSPSGQLIAGIGQNPDNRTGLVLINDAQGNPKTVLEVLSSCRGRIGIMSGGAKPIVALTEGERGGGVFYACAAGGNCDPLMVSAGTNETGVGVVTTGPQFYIQGPTGAPGSFLIGKGQ